MYSVHITTSSTIGLKYDCVDKSLKKKQARNLSMADIAKSFSFSFFFMLIISQWLIYRGWFIANATEEENKPTFH